MKETREVIKLYMETADGFYSLQGKRGIRFTKGRLKFRKDVKKALSHALSILDKWEGLPSEGEILNSLCKYFNDEKQLCITYRDQCSCNGECSRCDGSGFVLRDWIVNLAQAIHKANKGR